MGAKTTTWNEFSSTIASAIICLATNQKFNFSKYIFKSMVKNLDNAGKFLMYPRFVQVFLDKQLEGMSSHKRIYVTPFHTKKIFGNMKRVGKGFSGRETPLFPTMVVQNQAKIGEETKIKKAKRKDTEVPQPSGPTTNVADEAVYEERDDSLERAATTGIGLDIEQDMGNINKTKSKATPNEPSSLATSSGGGPRRQEAIGDTIAQTRSENVSKFSNDPILARENKDCSSSGDYKFKTKSQKVREERRIKKSQAQKIIQGEEIDDIDKDAKITLVDETQGRYGDDIMFDEKANVIEDPSESITTTPTLTTTTAATTITTTNTRPKAKGLVIHEEEQATTPTVQEKANVVEEPSESITTTPTLTTITTATIITATSTKPKAKGLVIHYEDQATTPIGSSQQPSQTKIQDKVKVKMIKPEPVKKLSKKDQLKLDEEVAQRLQAEFNEQERIEREKVEKEAEKLFDKAMKRVNTFVDIYTELVEGSEVRAEVEIAQESCLKRVGIDLEQESIKKQKLDEDKETVELQRLIKVIPDKEEL
ncbi:hypothetical protein Tco_1350216 [Tanacetum coccineum]